MNDAAIDEARSPAPAASAAGAPEPRIELEPREWGYAPWRKVKVPPPPPPQPFDRLACAGRLRRLRFTHYGWQPDWSPVGLPPAMTREEAHYWLLAMAGLEKDVDLQALTARLEQAKIDGQVSIEEVRGILAAPNARFLDENLMAVARHLVDADELAPLLLEPTLMGAQYNYRTAALAGFREHILPHLTEAQAGALRDRLRPGITPAAWPTSLYDVTPQFQLAAALGMHDELLPVIQSWPDDAYTKEGWSDHYHQPQLVLYGLRDPALVEHHARRLRLRLRTPLHLVGWLAHTETSALDVVRDGILGAGNKEEAEALTTVFCRVKAPEAAGPMLELYLKSKAPKLARQWLEANPAHAVAGLVPVAAGRGVLAEAAVEILLGLKRSGFGPAIAAAVDRLPNPGQVRAAVLEHEEVTLALATEADLPEALRTAIASVPAKKLPAWVAVDALPAISIGGRRLAPAQVTVLLAVLQTTPLGEPQALIQELRQEADPASLDRFAWKLFERWLTEGGPSKDKWAMAAIGHIAGDASVLRLAPLLRNWPGESQHQRAVFGLEVLRAVGSDAALMQLSGIAQKLKFQGLKAKAQEMMEAIAQDKGLTRAELEDRVVPDCELDERGRRVFDYGTRQFHFVLGPEMKPMVRDADGKLRSGPPDPGAKDDLAKAQTALEEWKLIKKQIKDVARIQADRLEQAMVTGRRWKPADFQALHVRHPLMTHLARLLLWGAYDQQGRLCETFRVTEDQELVDANDDPVTLAPDRRVGLVHALELERSASERWGQQFADYAIIPPFAQLGRPVHRLLDGEAAKVALDRFEGQKMPAPTLVFTLEKLGWVRGQPMDAGCFDEHSRQYPAANTTAVVTYDGTVSMGYILPDEALTLRRCYFIEGLREPSGYDDGGSKALALGKVDPVVLSETLHDLSVLSAKSKQA